MEEIKKNKTGPAKFTPTTEQRELVENLVAMGVRVVDLGVFIKGRYGNAKMSDLTIRQAFSEEIKNGLIKSNYKIANLLYKNATEQTEKHPFGNIAAQIFWLKTRGRWREVSAVELTGENGTPVQTINMTEEQFTSIAQKMLKDI